MQEHSYAIGQGVFIRTDTPEYAEEIVPFRSLEELAALCMTPRPNLTLDRIMVYSMVNQLPCAVTLSFMSASQGQRPDQPETVASA
jgi:hypothetical protein